MRVILALFLLVSFLEGINADDDDDALMCSGVTCLTQYVQAFAEHGTFDSDDDDFKMIQSDIDLHCSLDMQLAKCTSEAFEKCDSKSQQLVAIGRALVSYMVYDYRLDVCPNHLENEFYELLGPLVTDNGGPWDEKLKYLFNEPYADCAAKLDHSCLEEFVQMMKVNPNLCLNIPFKYRCLRKGVDCPAPITKALLDIFPQEANKVLAVLCK